MLIRFYRACIKPIYIYVRNKIRKMKKFLADLYYSNPLEVNADLRAEHNMTLKVREVKRQRRKLAIIYNLFVFFLFFSFLMFYDVADEDQYLFIYEFHKWW